MSYDLWNICNRVLHEFIKLGTYTYNPNNAIYNTKKKVHLALNSVSFFSINVFVPFQNYRKKIYVYLILSENLSWEFLLSFS